MTAEEYLVATVPELGNHLRAGTFTIRELAEAYLKRLEEVGPELNAVVTVTRDRALADVDRLDRELERGEPRGPLHGIPFGIKDLLAVEGYPTTWGAEPLREQQIDETAAVVERIEAAGGVLLGKLSMVELAGGFGYEQPDATFTGPGRNPWNSEAWSGGSSSGAGSSVPAGLVGFAIGSETWGSILTPAAYCGIAGHRPTYGTVSSDGAMTLSWTMDKIGPMCRSARGCELVLATMCDTDTTVASTTDPTSRKRLPVPMTASGSLSSRT